MSSAAQLRELVLSHLTIGPDGKAEIAEPERPPILAAFRRAAASNYAEEAGLAMLDLVGLFRKSGDHRAGDALVALLTQLLSELRFDDPERLIASLRGERELKRAPAHDAEAPEGSRKAHVLARSFRRV